MNREWLPLYTAARRCCCVVVGVGWVGWATTFMFTCTRNCYRWPSQCWGLLGPGMARVHVWADLNQLSALVGSQAAPASALAGSWSLVEALHHWPWRKGYLQKRLFNAALGAKDRYVLHTIWISKTTDKDELKRDDQSKIEHFFLVGGFNMF